MHASLSMYYVNRELTNQGSNRVKSISAVGREKNWIHGTRVSLWVL